jgi:hypothetical protein
MNNLHVLQTWELMQSRHAELLKEAQKAHLAQQAQGQAQNVNWLHKLLGRQVETPKLALHPNATPELG